mmetsp:Transcript_99803/g.282444  ORF Transcript_99803/g.282444 Transcript_99803/m.282444 type:complete len:279 (-) Transcript_99803:153-989(-)
MCGRIAPTMSAALFSSPTSASPTTMSRCFPRRACTVWCCSPRRRVSMYSGSSWSQRLSLFSFCSRSSYSTNGFRLSLLAFRPLGLAPPATAPLSLPGAGGPPLKPSVTSSMTGARSPAAGSAALPPGSSAGLPPSRRSVEGPHVTPAPALELLEKAGHLLTMGSDSGAAAACCRRWRPRLCRATECTSTPPVACCTLRGLTPWPGTAEQEDRRGDRVVIRLSSFSDSPDLPVRDLAPPECHVCCGSGAICCRLPMDWDSCLVPAAASPLGRPRVGEAA